MRLSCLTRKCRRITAWMGIGIGIGGIWLVVSAHETLAYTASKVWFEFRPSGLYRVHVNYTVPELKEVRESYVEFRQKKEAERYYWDLIRGAHFYPSDPGKRRFEAQPLVPDPW